MFRKEDGVVKDNKDTRDYRSLFVDMHSHVLPGIDDGAQTLEQSLVLVRQMNGLGIKKIIATPHVMADYFRNTEETISMALGLLKKELAEQKIDITIEAAAEYYLDEAFEELLRTKQLITMGDNYVLFELPFISKPHNLAGLMAKMTSLDYKPILAHPERYLYLRLPDHKTIKSHGCSLQVNTISFTGYYGKEIKKNAEELADNHLIDFISSDMHRPVHAAALRDALKMPYVKRLLNSNVLKNPLLA